ncbi:MAG TPA: hypothetical protein VET90_04760 [Candidatus Binatus sp.]|nr:hypothetical protein [Candidatus Binatus sp.]
MRAIRALLTVFFGLFLIGGIGSAIAAAVAKSRIESHGDESDDEFDIASIFTGQDFISKAPALRRGSALSWYGGGTVDLRSATLDPNGATLTARSIFGGLRLVVPETWPVHRDMIAAFGGVGDARSSDRVDTSLPVLRLEGFSVFGGIGIVSEAPDLDEKAAEQAEAAAASEAAAAFTEELPPAEPAMA